MDPDEWFAFEFIFDVVLRDPGITHLPLHLHPQVSLHSPSHGHSGHKTVQYTSFMVFPSVSLFSSQLSHFILYLSSFLLLCRVLAFLLCVVSTTARCLHFCPLLFTPIVLLSVSFPTFALLFVFVLLSLSQWSDHILETLSLALLHSY